MLNFIKYASLLFAKYRLGIDCKISTVDFYKEKFLSDQAKQQKICNIIYKKQQ